MSSTFMGLSIATRGLYTSQAAIAVTSNNISNIDSEGYSRRTVNQTSAGVAAVYVGSGCVGAGSEVSSITRVRDPLLDQKYWRVNSSLGEWEAKSDTLTEIEAIMGGTSEDSGLTAILEEFYSALEDLANDPDSDSARTVVQETGNAVCNYLNEASQQLAQLRKDVNAAVKTTVTEINSYARQIADLNQQIQQAGASADISALEDQRDLLIDELSKLVNIEVSETVVSTQADGTQATIMTISVNGATLVNGGKARQLECTGNSDGMYSITWQDTGQAFEPAGGELKGYLDIRDGTGTDYKGILYYSNQLDEFARSLAKAFNEGIGADGTAYYTGHAGGVGADSSTDIRFFSYDGKSSADLLASGADTDKIYANITAGNISLSQDVQNDTDKIAAASASGESGNNENINDLIDLLEDARMFANGTPKDCISSIISTLGTNSAYAERQVSNKDNLLNNINTRRTSVSGVSLNEETANLTIYQQAYNASAQMISAWDEIYKTTINLVSSD